MAAARDARGMSSCSAASDVSAALCDACPFKFSDADTPAEPNPRACSGATPQSDQINHARDVLTSVPAGVSEKAAGDGEVVKDSPSEDGSSKASEDDSESDSESEFEETTFSESSSGSEEEDYRRRGQGVSKSFPGMRLLGSLPKKAAQLFTPKSVKLSKEIAEMAYKHSFEDGESVESLLGKLNQMNINSKNITSLDHLKRRYSSKAASSSLSVSNFDGLLKNLHAAAEAKGASKRVIVEDKEPSQHAYSYKPSIISKSLFLLNKAFD